MSFNSAKQLISAVLVIFIISGCATTAEPEEKTDVFKLIEIADRAYKRGQWIEAEHHYQLVTERVPNDFYAWFRLGNSRLRSGQLESAIEALNAAIKRDSAQSKPYYNLATAYMLLAQNVLNESYKRLPEDDSGRDLIAMKQKKLNDIVYSPMRDMRSPAEGLISQ